MVALKNGVVQNKAGYPFDRSTGTWQNQNVAENPNVVQENVSNSDGENTSTNKKPDATTENSNSAETQQSDNEKKQPDAKTKETPAENPNQNAENKQSDVKDKQSGNKNEQPDTEQKKAPTETSKTPAKTPKPRVIQYNIDGKEVYISSNDWPRFQELRAQLASGTTLNDDLITKMKPILAETHLQDGTKIFNNEAQLDNIMKHHQGKKISSLDDVLRLVLHKIR